MPATPTRLGFAESALPARGWEDLPLDQDRVSKERDRQRLFRIGTGNSAAGISRTRSRMSFSSFPLALTLK